MCQTGKPLPNFLKLQSLPYSIKLIFLSQIQQNTFDKFGNRDF